MLRWQHWKQKQWLARVHTARTQAKRIPTQASHSMHNLLSYAWHPSMSSSITRKRLLRHMDEQLGEQVPASLHTLQ